MRNKRFRGRPMAIKAFLAFFLLTLMGFADQIGAQTNPSVEIFANKTAFIPNMEMKISIHTSPSGDQRRVDLYIAAMLPDGRILFFPDLDGSIVPVRSNALLGHETSEIIRLRIALLAQTGQYRWMAGLTEPGTYNLIGRISEMTTTLTEGGNLIALHDESAPEYNSDCLSCHRGVMQRATLNPSIRTIHAVMVPLIRGSDDNERCVTCHRGQVVLSEDKSPPNANLRRNVAVEICAGCHGPSGPGRQLYRSN